LVTWQYCVKEPFSGISCDRGPGADVRTNEKLTGDGGVAHSRTNTFIIILNKYYMVIDARLLYSATVISPMCSSIPKNCVRRP